MIKLRAYQQRAINELYAWLGENEGNPCLSMPTGSGKSVIIARICADLLQEFPETRVLMLTHVKELIQQNADKMRQIWPNAPLGIYSAGMRKRELGEPLTFAGIQSIRGRAVDIGHTDLVIVDECHLISHAESGAYRTLLSEMLAINPRMRVVGLTATPYRLGHGLITDAPAIFSAILEPVTIEQLIANGHLAKLSSKVTGITFDLSGVHKRGGEYIESELAAAVDSDAKNLAVAEQIINFAGDRRTWLVFCAGVKHAANMRIAMAALGISCECITGETPPALRKQWLADFACGRLRCITNANCLTTGIDIPGIDLIAMCRPTLSPSLYVQMGGRGLRVKPAGWARDCLVLDFAGVVATHGPITSITLPEKNGGKGAGEAPVKICEQCGELVAVSCRICPDCGFQFPATEKAPLALRSDDIMGNDGRTGSVCAWSWCVHTSKNSGLEMIRVDYHDEGGGMVSEYLTLTHGGSTGEFAAQKLARLCRAAGELYHPEESIPDTCERMGRSLAPAEIMFRMDGKFIKITKRKWEPEALAAVIPQNITVQEMAATPAPDLMNDFDW